MYVLEATSNTRLANGHFCGLKYAPSSFQPIYKVLENYGILKGWKDSYVVPLDQVVYVHTHTHIYPTPTLQKS